MRSWTLLIIGISLVIVSLTGFFIVATSPWIGRQGMMHRSFGAGVPSEFGSNGERIYYTATSNSGDPITFTGGPRWFQMHGGSCVNCHGSNGRGGRVPMTDQIAPDIRYNSLTSHKHEMEGGEEHPLYTDALIKRAITKGLDPAGEQLSYVMPRWQMSESDLNDLIGYLKVMND